MSEELILKLVTVAASAVLLFAGLVQLKWPPKKVNHLYGYRTPRSMLNLDTWNEANRFSTLLLIRFGLYLLLGAIVLAFLPNMHATVYMAYLLLVLPAVIAMLVATERHLKNVFDEEGRRR